MFAPIFLIHGNSYFRRFRIGGAVFRDRRHREGVFLRFAIVKSHRLFTSLPRNRRR